MPMSSSCGTPYSVAADSNSAFKEDPVWARPPVAPALPSRTAPTSPAPPSLKNSRRAILGERSSEHISPLLCITATPELPRAFFTTSTAPAAVLHGCGQNQGRKGLTVQDANFPLRETRVVPATIMEQLVRKLKASERVPEKISAARWCVEHQCDPALVALRDAALLPGATPQRFQLGFQVCDEPGIGWRLWLIRVEGVVQLLGVLVEVIEFFGRARPLHVSVPVGSESLVCWGHVLYQKARPPLPEARLLSAQERYE